ncbi:LysM domain containing protein [Naviculisporaceae sp. PSN 640]
MKSLAIAVVGSLVLAHGALAQFYEPPPTTADPNTILDCTFWHVAGTGDTCASIGDLNGLSIATFQNYNPSLAGAASSCNSKLIIGNSYCIEQNYGLPSEIYTSSTTSTAPTTTAPPTITTPTPHRTLPNDCNKFHFVVSGNLCPGIASQYNIPLATFYAWNPDVGSTCNNLWLEEYVCVGRVSYTPVTTTTSSRSTTTTVTGIVTPTPHRTLPTNCDRFHFVVQGNLCPGIAAQYNIPLAQFYAWNPDVGSNCNNLWLDEYVCVRTVGYVAPTSTTSSARTTTTSTGIATPTPHRTLPNNCDRFHFVVQGNLCPGIAAQYNIPLAQFYAWNPDVGSNCNNLWLEEYVCVRTVGYVPPTSTTTTTRRTTTTTTGGISTPTPFQPGMNPNCKQFHKVVSGNTCATIASQYGISLSNFYAWNTGVGNACQSLWLDYYVCVRV